MTGSISTAHSIVEPSKTAKRVSAALVAGREVPADLQDFGVSAAARLYTHGAKRWGKEAIHPKITLTGEKQRLECRIIHYHDRNISDMIQRFDRYTSIQAHGLRTSNNIGNFRSNFRRTFTRFFKCYVQRKGYREGYYGFLIGLFAGLMPLITHLKARLEDD